MLAHAAMGTIAWGDIDSCAPTASTHEPNEANRTVYDDGYATFRSIHKANRGIYRRLNG
jgi:hypothetical protein